MKVWIDQDLCTGDGLCEEIAPAVFTLLDDGLSYVKEGDKIFSDPGVYTEVIRVGRTSMSLAVEAWALAPERVVLLPDGVEDATRESVEECPGECIFIEE